MLTSVRGSSAHHQEVNPKSECVEKWYAQYWTWWQMISLRNREYMWTFWDALCTKSFFAEALFAEAGVQSDFSPAQKCSTSKTLFKRLLPFFKPPLSNSKKTQPTNSMYLSTCAFPGHTYPNPSSFLARHMIPSKTRENGSVSWWTRSVLVHVDFI